MRWTLSTIFGLLGAASVALTWAGCGGGFSVPGGASGLPPGPNLPAAWSHGAAFGASSGVIYVADSDQNLQGPRRVVEFDVNANGDVAPLRTIEGQQTELEGPTFVGLDEIGELFVVNYNLLQPMTVPVIAVFAPGASGDAAPIRKIWLSPSQSSPPRPYIAVDPAGYLYVANGARGAIDIYAPDANGTPPPVRSISGPRTRINNLFGVSLDKGGDIIATGFINNHRNTARVLVFAANANGNVPPTREIRGSNTGLYGPGACVVDGSGNLYVTDNQNTYGHILVFPPDANGNVPPVRDIYPEHPSFINGMALRDSELIVSQMYFPRRSVDVYPATANGRTKAVRRIAGDETLLLNFIGDLAVR